MDERVDKAIVRFVDLVQLNYKSLTKAILFGSYVKNMQQANSDIALVFKEVDEINRFDYQVDLLVLASQIDTRIEPHPFSEADLRQDNPFVAEILKTGFEIDLKSFGFVQQ